MINKNTLESGFLIGASAAGTLAGLYFSVLDHNGNVRDLNATVEGLQKCETGERDLSLTSEGVLECAGVETFMVTNDQDGQVVIDWTATKQAVIDASRSNSGDSHYPTGQTRHIVSTVCSAVIGGILGASAGAGSLIGLYAIGDLSRKVRDSVRDRISQYEDEPVEA